MSKFIRLFLKTFLILSLIFWLALQLFFPNKYKEKLVNLFSEQYSLNLKIDSELEIVTFPLPHILLKNVKITNSEQKQLYVGDIELYFNHKTFLSDDINDSVYSITLSNARFDLEPLIEKLKLIGKENYHKLDSLKLINTSLSFGKKCIDCLIIDYTDLSFANTIFWNDNYLLNSKFQYLNNNFAINAQISKNEQNHLREALIKLNNDFFSIEFSGKIENILNNPQLNGATTMNIINLEKLFLMLRTFRIEEQDLDNKIQILSAQKQDKQILLTSKTILKNNILIFFDISTANEAIKDLQGAIEILVQNDQVEFYYDIKASSIDLDHFLESEIDIAQLFSSIINSKESTYSNLKNITRSYIMVAINSIKLSSDEIKDLFFSADIIEGELYINKAFCKLPGNGKVDLSGYYYKNKFRRKFEGTLSIALLDLPKTLSWLQKDKKTDITLPRLFLKADLLLIPNRLRLDNIKAAFDSILMTGRVNLIKNAQNQNTIESALRFNELDLDKFGLNSKFDNLIRILHKSDPDKTSTIYFKEVDDYKWLRYLDFRVNLDFMAQKALFKGIELDNLFASIELFQGKLSLNNIAFKCNEGTNLDSADFSLSVDSLRPKINSNINFQNLSLDFLKRIFPDKSSLSQSTDAINTFSVYNFDGSIKLQASNLNLNIISPIRDLSIELSLNNGIINLINSKGKIFDGNFAAIGNMSAIEYVPQAAMSFVLNNVNPGQVTKTIADLDKIEGYMSASGSITSSGDTWKNLLQRASGKIDVIGRNIKWSGFDLDEITKTVDLNISAEDKNYRINYYTNQGSSFFNAVKGNIDLQGTILSFNNFKMNNNRASGVMAAKYDILGNAINAIARYSFIPIGSISPLNIDVKAIGQIPKLETNFDTNQLTKFITTTSSYNAKPTENKNSYDYLRNNPY